MKQPKKIASAYAEAPAGIRRCGNKKRLGHLLLIAGFLLSLILPLLTINRISGKLSETENRNLAVFPQLFNEEGHLNEGTKTGFENWISDNLGFRSTFVTLAANIQVKLLRQSTSEKVEIGRDGWYFYTPEHNIELATGEFVLSEDLLQDIAEKQQRISDYYAACGIVYMLVLTPSKASIYPEYIGSVNGKTQDTLCDQLEQYLQAHTDVHVVNVKHTLLEHKGDGKLFWKTDTHWTQLGSYLAFQEIAAQMNLLGIETTPFDVSLGKTSGVGEFSAMLGVKEILGEETLPAIQWESHITPVQDGALFDSVTAYQQSIRESQRYPVYLYENPDAPNRTLLIYGDSQWAPARSLPLWLGENFQRVISTRIRTADQALDHLAQPDVVIFGCSERMIDRLLSRAPAIPMIESCLPDLPAKEMISEADYGQWLGRDGVWLDRYNGEKPAVRGTIEINTAEDMVSLLGWAADFCSEAPFSQLYLKVGDIVLQCEYGIKRDSVVNHFKLDSLLNTGFTVTFPADYLKDGEVGEIAFYGVSADGQYLYEPVTYQLNYSE